MLCLDPNNRFNFSPWALLSFHIIIISFSLNTTTNTSYQFNDLLEILTFLMIDYRDSLCQLITECHEFLLIQ